MREAANIDGKKVLVKDYIFTWSNFISLSRVLVVIPIIYLHMEDYERYRNIIIALVAYGGISDYLDGLVARWRDEVSELGKILDPVADKLMAFFLFLYTVIIGWIPVWYFVIGVIRDLLIMAGSGQIQRRRGKVAMSIMSGKISVNVMAVYWISVFFFRDATGVHTFLLYTSVAVMVYSFIEYAIRHKRIIEGADFN